MMLLKKRNSNFKLLVTLPNNAEAGKRVSVTDSSHRIRPERQNKSMRDEELRKAEHLSNVKRQRSDGTNLVMCFNQNDLFIWSTATLNAYWQTLRVSSKIIRPQASTSYSVFFLKHSLPTTACLIERCLTVLLTREKGRPLFVRHDSNFGVFIRTSIQRQSYHSEFKHSPRMTSCITR